MQKAAVEVENHVIIDIETMPFYSLFKITQPHRKNSNSKHILLYIFEH